ncbi:MAG TPA: RagB/SusD family nutrient uptake outer membrane protein [Longimicrobiaceae bacterium]|nr:RagB/SusD family nutrient uptake outer membrane protein [Longimicrobiaceae bacterium]
MRNLTPRAGWRAAGLLSLALALGAVGCSDFLSTAPKGELTSANFFQTKEQAIEATNATYSILRGWQVHVFAWIGMTDIVSDDATKGSTPTDASFLLELDNLNFDPGNSAFSGTWDGYYQGVYRANIAIQNIPNVDMDPALRARLVGENKFLRAYFYFFLVRAFGGVPLVTEPLAPSEFTQPRATADEVYALIEQDLKDAIAVLPAKSAYSAADLGRATKGAAQALLAKVYLFRKDYQSAYQYATAVINSGEYGLNPDYAGVFTEAGENGTGSVFEVQAVALEEGGAGSQYSQVQGVRGTPNLGWGFNDPSPNLEASYEPGDPRLEATILYPWELIPDGSGKVVYLNLQMENNRYNEKAFISPDTPRGSGNGGKNIRLIRYSDVLLTAAEAAAQLNKTAEAQSWLNMVRERARGGQRVTLGFSAERLGEDIATQVLGLAPGTSRVFVRYVGPNTAAYAAGLRGFDSKCADGKCKAAEVPPVQVVNADLIESVNGMAITTPQSYRDALATLAPGGAAVLQVTRVQQSDAGITTSIPMVVTLRAEALLPDVTSTGQALIDAIWRERRWELAMEQHRWFDIIRQGRAQTLMAAAGKTFQSFMVNYPIPSGEVQIAGLQQNPGY